MLDIKLVRANPELVKENIKKKFQDEKLVLVDEVLELDKQYRDAKARGRLACAVAAQHPLQADRRTDGTRARRSEAEEVKGTGDRCHGARSWQSWRLKENRAGSRGDQKENDGHSSTSSTRRCRSARTTAKMWKWRRFGEPVGSRF